MNAPIPHGSNTFLNRRHPREMSHVGLGSQQSFCYWVILQDMRRTSTMPDRSSTQLGMVRFVGLRG